MNTSRHALPLTAFKHLPIEFTYQIDPKTRTVQLIINTSEEFAPLLMDGLQILTQVAMNSAKFLAHAHRERRIEDRQEEHKHNVATIQAAYWGLRDSGLLYRAAVHAICDDPKMPYHGRWNFTTYGHTVKHSTRPAIAPPVLKQVPKE